MSDKPISDKPGDGWVMPEPAYRTSEGHTPKVLHQPDPAADVPTEPGFHEATTVETKGLPLEEDISDLPTIENDVVTPAPVANQKKRGCARSFLAIVSLIVLAVAGVVIALIYFLFYYKSADSGTF